MENGAISKTTSGACGRKKERNSFVCVALTFLNVLNPAKMLPPIHVEYLRSGGAKILMRMSLTATRCTSDSRRSPKPLVSVLPPDSTMLE